MLGEIDKGGLGWLLFVASFPIKKKKIKDKNWKKQCKEDLDYSSAAEKRGQFDKWTLKFGA